MLDFSDLEPVREQLPPHPCFRDLTYFLVDPSASAVKKYRQSTQAAAKMTLADGATLEDVRTGKVAMRMGDIDMSKLGAGELPYLADCLRATAKDGKDRDVSLQTVESWPNRLVQRLIDRRNELFPLEETLGGGKAGGASSGSPSGSASTSTS